MNRRRALSLFSRVPFVAPLAMKAIQDEAAGKLIGGQLSGLSCGDSAPQPVTNIEPDHYRAALQIPSVRNKIESLIYEQNFHIIAIDPDLAAKRSFSLAAKIAYQRQRNVSRRMDEMQNPYSWGQISRIVAKFCGL